jgi:radical SAM protein with 4Fe4S-binding SPASM domain
MGNEADIPLFEVALIELQSHCNRRCFFCPRQGDVTGARFDADGRPVRSSMSTVNALRILDELEEMGFTGRVSFHHLSEPFLDPRLIAMAQAARDRGMTPYEHTNGDVLLSAPNAAALRRQCDVFEYVTVGLYDDTPGDLLEEKREFWRTTLPCEVRFSELTNVYPRTDVAPDPRLIREKQVYPDGPCSRPLLRLIVHYNGNMALCCEDMAESHNLGSVTATSVRACWYSENHQRVIQSLLAGDRPDPCRRCALPPTRPADSAS